MVRRLIHLSALFALLTLSLPLSGRAQDGLPGIGRAKSETIDLGAMMLTPGDLEAEGLEG